MRYSAFVVANVTGALLWASGLLVIGHVAYSVPAVRYAAYAVAAVSSVTFTVVPFVVRRRAAARSGEAVGTR
jgi:membrane-associated protein